MRILVAPLLAAIAIALAAPGHADPGVVEASTVDPTEFIASLHRVGIDFDDPAQAIAAGQAVCGLAATGETGLELLTDLRNANPALTINGAAQFATIAAKAYCPQQLAQAGGSSK